VSKEETEFIDGMFVSRRDGAPDFVVCSLGFKVDEIIEFLKKKANDKGWVNADILMSKTTNGLYAKLDTYVPKEQNGAPHQASAPSGQNNDVDDIPF